MKRVILETPFKGENWEFTEENIHFARLCMRDSLLRGEAVFASHLLYTQEGVLDDKIPDERKLGIEAGFAWKEVSDSTVAYINRGISRGMELGIRKAIELGHEWEYRALGWYPKDVPRIITLTGSSGAGKSSIAKKILESVPNSEFIKSYTTRAPRESDIAGEYECGVPPMEFAKKQCEFLKIFWAHGNMYGTLKSDIVEALAYSRARIMLLVPEAVEEVRKIFSRWPILLKQIRHFYILSPGEDEIRRRLSGRGEGDIKKRVEDCKKWDSEALSSDIPYIFLKNSEIGSGIDKAAEQIKIFL